MDVRDQPQKTLGDASTLEREPGGGGMSRVFMAIVSLILAAPVLSCQPGEGASRSNETAVVEQRNLSATVLAIGALRPEIGAEVRVGSRISGRVQRLRANIGDRVTKGQVIAELETAELNAIVADREAQLRLAEARLAAQDTSSPEGLARAAAEVARAVATEQLTSAELTRQEQLLASRGATAADVEAARERHLVARAQLATARREFDLTQRETRAEHSRAVAALELARVEWSFTIIRAPISGTIASVATQEGETVAAGLSAPTFVTIVDLSRLQVHAYVDEVDIGKVRLGQEATFAVDAFPARDFAGRVAAIYPTATIQDNVVKYIVALDIADDSVGLLRPEMTASVRITLEPRSVLAIPARAIRRDRGRNVVTVRTNEGDVSRPVRVGWRDGSWIEIVEGLRAGERVVLDPPAPPMEERR
jgi:multidrug efflux pump subunit AcrA (membrane-fusion protein)